MGSSEVQEHPSNSELCIRELWVTSPATLVQTEYWNSRFIHLTVFSSAVSLDNRMNEESKCFRPSITESAWSLWLLSNAMIFLLEDTKQRYRPALLGSRNRYVICFAEENLSVSDMLHYQEERIEEPV